MALTINHNLMAMNTARNLGTAYGGMATSVQRLSSGLRVGTAADDAAGLAIRELMRADIKAINQGIRNANDAISMIQVADGALGIIDEKLIRMKELAMQASTGTYSSDQRIIIDSEFQAMKSEIDRIAHATDFNGVHLLRGDLSAAPGVSSEALTENLMLHLDFNTSLDDTSGNGFTSTSTGTSLVPGVEGSQAVEFNGVNSGMDTNFGMTGDQFTIQLWFNTDAVGPNISQLFTSEAPPGKRRYEIQLTASGTIEVWYSNSVFTNHVVTTNPVSTNEWHLLTNTYDNGEYKLFMDGEELITRNVGTGNVAFLADTSFGYDPNQPIGAHERFDGMLDDIRIYNKALSPAEIKQYYDVKGDVASLEDSSPDTKDMLVHFGSGNDSEEDYYRVSIGSVTSEALGIAQTQIETQSQAQSALSSIDQAMIHKDKVRANLGAMQNRLKNTITNLSIQAENLQASESRISDADVSQEMTEFVREQILAQSATAMLAQANSFPKMALQLIQG